MSVVSKTAQNTEESAPLVVYSNTSSDPSFASIWEIWPRRGSAIKWRNEAHCVWESIPKSDRAKFRMALEEYAKDVKKTRDADGREAAETYTKSPSTFGKEWQEWVPEKIELPPQPIDPSKVQYPLKTPIWMANPSWFDPTDMSDENLEKLGVYFRDLQADYVKGKVTDGEG